MRSVRRRAITGLAIVGTAALIAGCSGDDDNGGSADPTPTPTEMVETTETEEANGLDEDELLDQANVICADVSDELDELGDPTSEEPDELVAFLDEGLELQEGGIEELRTLVPPEEIADDYEEALERLDAQRSAIEDVRDRIDDGEDPEEVFTDVNDEIEGLEADSDEALEDLGLDACVSDDNGSGEETETQTETDSEADSEAGLTTSLASSSPLVAIPDDDQLGVADTVTIEATGAVQEISVSVDVTHPFIGDLVVTLTAPTGEEAVLSDRDGASTDDLSLTLDETSPELAPLLGVSAEGEWQLQVVDLSARDEGTFDSWSLEVGAG